MPRVTIYTSVLCPFCHRAKRLLKDKNVAFEEIDVTFSPTKRGEMAELAGSRTVPQIFIDDSHIGNCEVLFALEQDGRLDIILAGAT
jgi:glutaredoxin 3